MTSPIRVKILSPWFNNKYLAPQGIWNGLEVITDKKCRDYDWLVVYDEMLKKYPVEELACNPEHTILVTQEPPTIKFYPPVYTRQFNYVLSTHDGVFLQHPHHRQAEGCLVWLNQRSYDENAMAPDFPKSELISVVASGKQQKHTEHHKRYRLIKSLKDNIKELVWYGKGVEPLDLKYNAMDKYKYHLAIENHIHPFHWSEKLSDAFLSLCLPFYAGDPRVDDILPADSFIRIPIDDPKEALRIIQAAIDNNEYERRLPAIIEARRRIIDQYNLFMQIKRTITEHQDGLPGWKPTSKRIIGRHKLRHYPIPLLRTFYNNIRCKLLLSRFKRPSAEN